MQHRQAQCSPARCSRHVREAVCDRIVPTSPEKPHAVFRWCYPRPLLPGRQRRSFSLPPALSPACRRTCNGNRPLHGFEPFLLRWACVPLPAALLAIPKGRMPQSDIERRGCFYPKRNWSNPRFAGYLPAGTTPRQSPFALVNVRKPRRPKIWQHPRFQVWARAGKFSIPVVGS